MKDEEEYRDYLVDKAKELLNEELSEAGQGEDLDKPEVPGMEDDKKQELEEEATSEIPFAWDPREVEHLKRNRKKMDNGELKEFLERDSKFQEELREMDDWKGFTRWEERFMVQHHLEMDAEEIAEELGRNKKEVKLKLHMLGMEKFE